MLHEKTFLENIFDNDIYHLSRRCNYLQIYTVTYKYNISQEAVYMTSAANVASRKRSVRQWRRSKALSYQHLNISRRSWWPGVHNALYLKQLLIFRRQSNKAYVIWPIFFWGPFVKWDKSVPICRFVWPSVCSLIKTLFIHCWPKCLQNLITIRGRGFRMSREFTALWFFKKSCFCVTNINALLDLLNAEFGYNNIE